MISKTLENMFNKSEQLKKDILKKYEKKLARQLIKGAEQNADYRYSEDEPKEKWMIYFVEELEERL